MWGAPGERTQGPSIQALYQRSKSLICIISIKSDLLPVHVNPDLDKLTDRLKMFVALSGTVSYRFKHSEPSLNMSH